MPDSQPVPSTAPASPAASGFALSFLLGLADTTPGRVLTALAADAAEVVRLDIRVAGADPALHQWDAVQQNYLASSGPHGAAGTALVLEATIMTAHAAPYRSTLVSEVRLGIALSRLPAGPVPVELRLQPGYAELLVAGVTVDEDWPCGGAAQPVQRLEPGPACSAARCGELSEAPASASSEQRRMTSDQIPGSRIQYWTPPGANQWLGDTMMFQDGERLHICYLIDRRHGSSKAGCGGHQIAHLSTTDLRSWTSHPLALPLVEPWETCGTGSLVRHDGRWWLLYGLHTDRAIASEAVRSLGFSDVVQHHTVPQRFDQLGGPPMGTAIAVSDDGITFRRLDLLVHPAQNPSVFPDPAGGFCLFAGYGATGLYRSQDLLHWRAVDHFIIPHGPLAPSRNTTECICHHAWNGWHYLLGGRTGFWMSRAMAGPYWDQDDAAGRRAVLGIRAEAHADAAQLLNPRPAGTVGQPAWDLYDGLWVPMIAALADGRRILSGWLQGEGDWAGCLVLRELHQQPDGTLGLSWPAEVVPPVAAALELAWDGGWPSGRAMTLGADAGRSLLAAPGLPAECLITVTFLPGPGAGPYGITVLGSGDLVDGCELQFDPHRRRAQWSSPAHGRPAAAIPDQEELFAGPEQGKCIWQMTSPHLASKGRDFSITRVAGLDTALRLRLLITQHAKDGSVIIDAELNGGSAGCRTLITRRARLPGRRIQLSASSGAVQVRDLTVQPLADRR